MGSSESTGRLNGTEREEDERRRESGGGSTGAAATAIAATAGVVAAWGISRMFSNNTESDTEEDEARTTREEEKRRQESGGGSTGAAATTIAATAGVVAAWGISRMFSNNTESDTEEEDEARTTREEEKRRQESGGGSTGAAATAIAATAGVVAAWDISRMVNEHVEPVQYGKSTTKSIWSPPPRGGYKMNTDGGFRPTEGQYSDEVGQNDAVKRPSAYAGILRNHHGECIQAFRQFYIGVTDSLEAEIVGILKGLELLVERGLKGAILESDSDQAVFWINEVNKSYQIPKDRMAHCKGMIDKCRKLCRKNSITINNIDRSANKCADALASLALGERYQDVQTDLPDKVKKLVDDDKTAYTSWLRSDG